MNISAILTTGLANKLDIPSAQNPFTSTNAGPQIFMKDITGSVTNAFILSQSTAGTYDLSWGSNSTYKSYTYLKDTYLNAIRKLEDGASPLSLGGAQQPGEHKIACYENTSSAYTQGSFFYGSSLFQDTSNNVQGLAFYATGTKLPRNVASQSTATHEDPTMLLTQVSHRVGIGMTVPG